VEINKQYFSLSEFAQSQGLKNMATRVRQITAKVMQNWNIKQSCTQEDMMTTIQEIRAEFEDLFTPQDMKQCHDQDETSIQQFLFAPCDLESLFVQVDDVSILPMAWNNMPGSPQPTPEEMKQQQAEMTLLASHRLRHMVAETISVLHSNDFQTVLKTTFDAGFQELYAQIESVYMKRKRVSAIGSDSSTMESNETMIQIPFVSAMMQVTKSFDTLLPATLQHLESSPLLDRITKVPEMDLLCQVVHYPIEQLYQIDQPTTQALEAPVTDSPCESNAAQSNTLHHTSTLVPGPSPKSEETIA
jgi:hypothetical protein